ncbi:MFS transporter [Bacillus mycoides]|uniref:Major facilitator superfamily (MFS) profile domain-containing protein n=1 Tax=Bacillus mycoides TaxID=1405 RepID=A0ABC9QW58_BACMY|nr:MFS transporter [Bacillus mycoides]EJR29918.1 hypothetical protein III_05687 [Bacillus mycoides]
MGNALTENASEKEKYTILVPFKKSKDFKYLYISQLFSVFGSSITMFILPIIVYQISNSTKAMGTVMSIYMIPCIVALPFSGIMVDAFNRIKIMIVTNVIMFITLVTFATLALYDQLTMNWVYFLVSIIGLMDALFRPAYAAVRAKIFTKEIRNSANSVTEITRQLIKIITPVIGGVIITMVSISSGFGLYSFCYVISFICLLLLRNINFKMEKRKLSRISLRQDFFESISVLKSNSWLWITILTFSFINICTGGIMRILIPWLINIHYELEPYVLGMVMGATALGAISCAAVYGMRKRWRRRGLLAYGGVALSAISFLLMAFVSNIALLVLFMFLNGVGNMIFSIIWEVSLQELVPEEKFGRVASLDMFGSLALLPLGFFITGWIADIIGGIMTMVILSTSILLIVIVVIFNKEIKQYD